MTSGIVIVLKFQAMKKACRFGWGLDVEFQGFFLYLKVGWPRRNEDLPVLADNGWYNDINSQS